MSKINSFYAWIETQPDGEERVVTLSVIQLVSPTLKAAESFRPEVQKIAEQRGLPVDLVRFNARETLQRVRKGGSAPIPLRGSSR